MRTWSKVRGTVQKEMCIKRHSPGLINSLIQLRRKRNTEESSGERKGGEGVAWVGGLSDCYLLEHFLCL